MPSLPSLPRPAASRDGGPRLPALPPADRGAVLRHWMTRTFSGRAVVAGVAVKIVAFALALVFGRSGWIEVVDACGDVALIVGVLVLGFHLFVDMKLRLLWRVRHKLSVSYIFIGFVPALLIICFFLVAGLLIFINISGYLMRVEINQIVSQVEFVAQSASDGIQRARDVDRVRNVLEARVATLSSRYPGASIALAPSSKRCDTRTDAVPPLELLLAGAWRHTPPPGDVPGWISCSGFAGLVTYENNNREFAAVRAVQWLPGSTQVVVVDIPVDAPLAREVDKRLNASLQSLEHTPDTEGRADSRAAIDSRAITTNWTDGDRSAPAPTGRTWIALVDFNDWTSGEIRPLMVRFRMSVAQIYNRIASGSSAKVEGFTSGQLLMLVLAGLGVLFLMILGVAFATGLALARSITGSVHELAEGTERVRRGDFSRRVPIMSRDQLGDLSASFNSMTASIEDLLQQKAEKERLEQELRIARNIQMSLLPQGSVAMRGVSLTAHCEPAREVGGDYYDFLPIDEHTLGVLIADVSGKGTSAALYMAELKGIVLSLSQRHRSPRDLLIEADRIISKHLDSRSFITVTYLVVDLRAGTLRYARAGHCPMVYVPGPYADLRPPQLMTPDGMVLGLQLDEGRTFGRLLEEMTVPLGRGDLFVLYTDGLTEAMNSEGDCFGDARLASLVAQHADLAADELRERILREIDAFTDSALQQDDMTMVLLRVEEVGQSVGAPALAHADA